MATDFRPDDQNSNTFARFPVEITTNVKQFTSINFSDETVVATTTSTNVGYRLDTISISSNDTSPNNFLFYLRKKGDLLTNAIPIGFCPVVAGAGTNAINESISALQADTMQSLTTIDNNGNPYISLSLDYELIAKLQVSPTPTKTIQIVTISSNF